jgi:hypothetical protein
MCKVFRRTFSILPDFIHPGKCHTHRFVSSVFDFVLLGKKPLKRAGSRFGIYPQTIRKWINNFSSDRHIKVSLFCPLHFKDTVFQSKPLVFASALWEILQSKYSKSLAEGTKRICEHGQRRLY